MSLRGWQEPVEDSPWHTNKTEGLKATRPWEETGGRSIKQEMGGAKILLKVSGKKGKML